MSTIMITVGNLAENGAESLERYAQGVIPLLEQAGVKILGRYQGIEALVGEHPFDLVAVMEFPSLEAMKQFLASDAYGAMIPDRERAFKYLRTFACNTL
ncbi:DUF1330 domain-containing protein [Chamaesiphon minutus]|jgi:uncharacterized protein (DUF1330 family)|uniref:DUF1330 domain-containing protein n=1 Tax=Chamaesiphon minutus (strain ATCC 27169 / PCC 6605) TaxID=1173020 RepID=K9URE5_CHAP6|nr:DUF1330 domain-containing protein [Chamaesiphon minutus]AFY97036.1 hypothetical protein Cha6605_6207 [Chamaesiphon minutus PCC 6605]